MSGILVAIRHAMEQSHPKERQLAEFIVAHPAETTRLTIVALAERSGASASTISRFCQALRFQSFGDFKLRLAAELASAAPPGVTTYQDIVAGAPAADIIDQVKQNHLRSIVETAPLLDAATVERAVSALQRARQIDLYGIATSGVVAADLYQKLIRLGRRTSVFTDSHLQITSASTLTPEDVVLAISYSGETPEIIDAVACAKERGATTISLTKYGPNRLATLTDVQLYTSALEEGVRRGEMASRIAQLFVLDVLFTGLLSGSFNEYTPKLEDSYQLVRRFRKPMKGR